MWGQRADQGRVAWNRATESAPAPFRAPARFCLLSARSLVSVPPPQTLRAFGGAFSVSVSCVCFCPCLRLSFWTLSLCPSVSVRPAPPPRPSLCASLCPPLSPTFSCFCFLPVSLPVSLTRFLFPPCLRLFLFLSPCPPSLLSLPLDVSLRVLVSLLPTSLPHLGSRGPAGSPHPSSRTCRTSGLPRPLSPSPTLRSRPRACLCGVSFFSLLSVPSLRLRGPQVTVQHGVGFTGPSIAASGALGLWGGQAQIECPPPP